MHLSRAATLAWIDANVRVDPAFAPFVSRVRAAGASIRVVSSGIASIIHHVLDRAGVDVDVLANDVDFSAGGWRIAFLDESANAHDKAAHVRAAAAAGSHTVYIGDGISDFDAAAVANERFAKRGRALEFHLRESGLAYSAFASFDEIADALRERGLI
jgi:HAD superfamily phosphoserine phosphatase-like hydrolase